MFFLTFPLFLCAQLSCKYISLRAQAEIDGFPKTFSHCDSFYAVEITDQNGFVYNLDSLERITELEELNIFGIDSLQSIAGLNRLKKVGKMYFVQKRFFKPFENLDTITSLAHEANYDNADLSVYQNINHIYKELRLTNNMKLTGFPKYTSANGFWIDIVNNEITNYLLQIIPGNVNSLQWLLLQNNKNLSLEGMEAIDTIQNIFWDGNKECNFSQLHQLKKINYFQSKSENVVENQYPDFHFIDTLEALIFEKAENLIRIDSIFSKLKIIKQSVRLKNNLQLLDIHKLNEFPAPGLTSTTIFVVSITNNPLLEDCLSPFICDILELYPQKVIIQNNGLNCEKSELLSGCINSTAEESDSNEFSVYPNPTYARMYWHSTKPVDKLEIINANGQVVLSILPKESNVDISFLNPGVYYYRISCTNFSQIKKLVKM